MRNAFLALAFFAGSISFSNAQPGRGMQQRSPEERAKQQTERLSERLKLTADQKTKLEAIFLTQGKSMDSLRNAVGQGGDRQAMFQKMQPLREQTDKKVASVLTEDQQKEYKKLQEENRARMGGGGGQGRRGGQGGQETPPPPPSN